MKSPSIPFIPDSDIAVLFQNFCRLTGMDPSQAINAIIRPTLERICAQGDPELLISYLRGTMYRDEDQAAWVIVRYERYCQEHASRFAYNPEAELRHTREGDWKIVFRSTHPDEKGAICRQLTDCQENPRASDSQLTGLDAGNGAPPR